MIKLVTIDRTKFGETYQILCLQHDDYNHHVDESTEPMEILFVEHDVHEIPWTNRGTLLTSGNQWRLASALYDYRESGSIGIDVKAVELPDGSLFVIDEELQ